MSKLQQNFIEIEFKYCCSNDVNFILCEDLCKRFGISNEKFLKMGGMVGKAHLLVPSWIDMYGIERKSTKSDPYTEGRVIWLPEKIRINKILKFLKLLIDHTGRVYFINRKFIENLDPSLGSFLTEKIDDLIDEFVGDGLSKEEQKDLSYECFNYFSAVEKVRSGKENVDIPPTPECVLLERICKEFNCTPNIARQMSKRDIEMFLIMREQENICKNPIIAGRVDKIQPEVLQNQGLI